MTREISFSPDALDTEGPAEPSVLSRLADQAAGISFDVVDVAGVLDRIEAQAHDQTETLSSLRRDCDAMTDANRAVRGSVEEVAQAAETARQTVSASLEDMTSADARNRKLAAWVGNIRSSLRSVNDTLETVEANNADITSIAKQVNILAINAKIEAGRAGDAGRGFAVVAEAINALSKQTAQAADSITEAVSSLSMAIVTLQSEAEEMSADATQVLQDSERTDTALNDLASGVDTTAQAAEHISTAAERAGRAIEAFGPAFSQIADSITETARGIEAARARMNGMIDGAEAILQSSVEAGGAAEDARFIAKGKALATEISALFESGIAQGRITEQALFARSYSEIPGTDPKQLLAPFTGFTDAVLPPVLEEALAFDPRVVFCAAVDINGYLPTHNRKFSKPQGRDPVWNAANSRNRRIFNDRVGLKAGRNTAPFLLQVYRRDMGGGKFALMKDLSAPIRVRGRHWGGVRLAYKA